MRICFTQHATLLDSDLETPVGLFIRLVGDGLGILLESAEADGRWGRYSIIATDFLLSASCGRGLMDLNAADERLASLRALAGTPFLQGLREIMRTLHIESPAGTDQGQLLLPPPQAPPITRALYGYLGYGAASLLEPKLAPALPPEDAEACFVLPGTLIVFDHGFNRIVRITLRLDNCAITPLSSPHAGPLPCPVPARAHPLADKENYMAAVVRLKEQIRQGEIVNAALSASFAAPLAESPFSLYRRLRRLHPSPYMFYMRLPHTAHGALLGSSPEVLVTCEANALRLCPIAGTRPRSQDLSEDVLFGDELTQNPREKARHAMLVDQGRDDLGRIAAPGSIQLERFMEVERFSHVMRLASRIKADLAPGLDALDVLAAVFPAGTVSGSPKIRAMELAAREEQVPRGPYAGAIGWLGLDKEAVHLDFGITVRSLWVREGQVRWQAGTGIAHDSAPETEWRECRAEADVIGKVALGEVRHIPESVLSPDGMRPPANFPATPLALDARSGPPRGAGAAARAPLRIAALIEKLAQGEDLSGDEAAEAFARLMDGELSSSQAGALLFGLRAKGETPEEMAEAVNAVLARAIPVPPIRGVSIDIVGTGGDGKGSFNCSTAAALTLAGMGHKVLKHGNRSVSSRCGSADVLEQLGVPLDTPPEAVAGTLEREGFVFLFAPRYHPSFHHIMPVRRELGVRTLFNILGPLVNPARPTHHLCGVADAGRLSLVAATLARCGGTGVVVYGAGGYDELTPIGEAEMVFVYGARDGRSRVSGLTRPGRLNPAEYGFSACAEGDLAVEGPEQAAGILRDLLCGRGSGPMRDMLILNLGMALYLLGSDSCRSEALDRDRGYNRPRMRAAMEEARAAVAAGAGGRFCHA